MIQYTPTSQLLIQEFKTPFQLELDANNRWVKLSQIIPWDDLAGIYYSGLESNTGRAALGARIAIGAMIIKHRLNLSDRETVATIQENPYMQYFLGLDTFNPEPLFDPSLFVNLRKRMGADVFDRFNQTIIKKAAQRDIPTKPITPKNQLEETDQPTNRGKLQLDATVADIYIKYPTDLDLLNSSREKTEQFIDKLYDKLGKVGTKPRTYRKVARKNYLNVAKKKNKRRKELRRAIRLQLNYVKRNVGYLDKMLDSFVVPANRQEDRAFPLSRKEQRYLWVIREVHRQQQEMFNEKKHQCADRIVSIHQPYVRPIVRGKAKGKVEFGPKLGMSLDNGYTRINTFSWDAYNEGGDLIAHVQEYKKLHGHYPEAVIVDRIYATLENRKLLKDKEIRITAKPLGRPGPETGEQARLRRQEQRERNQIEGKFGQAKNGYANACLWHRLNQVRTRLRATAESWIGCIIFITNLIKWQKDYFIVLIFFNLKQPTFLIGIIRIEDQ